MKTYLVKFRPMEPYFFGNEKTFTYPDPKDGAKQGESQASNRYFIRSEYVMSQSTALGAVRYLLLPVKKNDWSYNDSEKDLNNRVVGGKSFDISEKRDFGKIRNISPVFLHNGKTPLVVAPFDHIIYENYDKKIKNKYYTPFTKYTPVVSADGEDCLYAEEYNAKAGVASAYMKLSDGEIIDCSDIFTDVTRIGINRSAENKGMFKKVYKELNPEYSFAVYVKLDDDVIPENGFVYLGQGKSAFYATFNEEENTITKQIGSFLRDDVAYFFGDAFVGSDIYKKSRFSVTRTKTYRTYSKTKTKVTKGDMLYKLVSAGSVFIPKDKTAFVQFVKKDNADLIGYNKVITKTEE